MHCEIKATASAGNDQIFRNPDSEGSGGRNMSNVAIVFIALGAVTASTILVLFYRRLHNQKEEIDFDDDDGIFSDTSGPPVLDMGPEKDMEGNELENVEII